jgi:hypothetical protein
LLRTFCPLNPVFFCIVAVSTPFLLLLIIFRIAAPALTFFVFDFDPTNFVKRYNIPIANQPYLAACVVVKKRGGACLTD